MPKTITLRLDDETYERFRRCAEAERRPIANLIETAALRQLDETLWADEAEMADIRADANLVARLKKGSHDAARRKGRFVE